MFESKSEEILMFLVTCEIFRWLLNDKSQSIQSLLRAEEGEKKEKFSKIKKYE